MNQSFTSKLRRFIFGLSTTEEIEVYQMVRKAEREAMWHLHGQGFSLKEIANLYNVTEKRMEGVLERKFKSKSLKQS